MFLLFINFIFFSKLFADALADGDCSFMNNMEKKKTVHNDSIYTCIPLSSFLLPKLKQFCTIKKRSKKTERNKNKCKENGIKRKKIIYLHGTSVKSFRRQNVLGRQSDHTTASGHYGETPIQLYCICPGHLNVR